MIYSYLRNFSFFFFFHLNIFYRQNKNRLPERIYKINESNDYYVWLESARWLAIKHKELIGGCCNIKEKFLFLLR